MSRLRVGCMSGRSDTCRDRTASESLQQNNASRFSSLERGPVPPASRGFPPGLRAGHRASRLEREQKAFEVLGRLTVFGVLLRLFIISGQDAKAAWTSRAGRVRADLQSNSSSEPKSPRNVITLCSAFKNTGGKSVAAGWPECRRSTMMLASRKPSFSLRIRYPQLLLTRHASAPLSLELLRVSVNS